MSGIKNYLDDQATRIADYIRELCKGEKIESSAPYNIAVAIAFDSVRGCASLATYNPELLGIFYRLVLLDAIIEATHQEGVVNNDDYFTIRRRARAEKYAVYKEIARTLGQFDSNRKLITYKK